MCSSRKYVVDLETLTSKNNNKMSNKRRKPGKSSRQNTAGTHLPGAPVRGPRTLLRNTTPGRPPPECEVLPSSIEVNYDDSRLGSIRSVMSYRRGREIRINGTENGRWRGGNRMENVTQTQLAARWKAESSGRDVWCGRGGIREFQNWEHRHRRNLWRGARD